MTVLNMFSEWRKALAMWRLWIALGDEDIRDRYRRTALGVLWIAGSFAVFVAVKVTIFGQMLAVSTAEFGLFVTIGFGAWTFINAMVLDACTVFTSARHWILGASLPYPVYILQAVYRNIKIFVSVLAVIVFALILSGRPANATQIAAVAGLMTYPFTGIWLAAILAPLCARYHDLYHAMQTIMRLLFFVTPILWMPSMNEKLGRIAELNPITHFIAIVRDPLIYGVVPTSSWLLVAAINLLGLLLAATVYLHTRQKVVFWV